MIADRPMSRSEALSMMADCFKGRREARQRAADTAIPTHLRYAYAVHVDGWNEIIDLIRAYVHKFARDV